MRGCRTGLNLASKCINVTLTEIQVGREALLL
jgi:hypothetical protein